MRFLRYIEIYIWLIPDWSRNGWATLSVKKNFWNIALAIRVSLWVENSMQYTNQRMNHAVKNQIYPKKVAIHISGLIVWYDFTKQYSHCHQNSYSHYHMTWEMTRYAKQLNLQLFTVTAYYWRLEFSIWIRMVFLKHQIQR